MSNISLTFLMTVKYRFANEKEKYENFLSVMKDFKEQRISVMALRERVMEIFAGHGDLLLGFNSFLPMNYEIRVPQIKKAPTRDDALAYACLLRYTLRDEIEKYGQFLNIMNDYGNERIDVVSFMERVKELFKRHIDLLERFNFLLPKECEITLSCENEQPPQKRKKPVDQDSIVKKRKADEVLQGHADRLRAVAKLFLGGTEYEDDRQHK